MSRAAAQPSHSSTTASCGWPSCISSSFWPDLYAGVEVRVTVSGRGSIVSGPRSAYGVVVVEEHLDRVVVA